MMPATLSSPRRLVPAVVSGAQVFIECPTWCTVDHVADPEGFIEDIWHAGDYADLKVPQMNKQPDLVAFARLGLDPTSSVPERREPFVVLDAGDEGFYMDPDQAVEFAANLEAFAAQIRQMARRAGGERSA